MFDRHKLNIEIMKMEDELNEQSIFLEVDCELIEKIRDGRLTYVALDVDESNQNIVLENDNGNPLLNIEKTPEAYHSCFLYNHGNFPYFVKRTLNFIGLNGGNDWCFTKIINIEAIPGTRFNYQGSDKPIIGDPHGDSCVWELHFELVPVPEEPRYYLMRWNPSVSSFTERDYRTCVLNMNRGVFLLEWSIYDWQEARRGDFFYMMRVGDDKAGILFSGQFISNPYPADDWSGTSKRKMYVNMLCMNPAESCEKPRIPLINMQVAIPEIEWETGHSGEAISSDVASRLSELWDSDEYDAENVN